jgi:hypothetical protein
VDQHEYFHHWEQGLQRRHLWENVWFDPHYRGGTLARPIDEAELKRVNEAFTHIVRAVGLPIAVVLSDEPARAESEDFYFHYEPCADHVFALSTSKRRSSLCTHLDRWRKLRPEFLAVLERIDYHLRADRIVDALLACFDEIGTVSRLLTANPGLPR